MNYLIVEITVDDPKVLAKPWKSAPRRWTLGDGEIYELYCTNNLEIEELKKLRQQETEDEVKHLKWKVKSMEITPHLDADLAVTLADDRPGMLAKAIGCVSAAGINIDGYIEISGVVHVLFTDLRATRKCLSDGGFRIVQEQQVALVPVADQPGAAARVFQRIAEAHINVRYTYLATRNRLVIAADKPQAIIDVLKTP